MLEKNIDDATRTFALNGDLLPLVKRDQFLFVVEAAQYTPYPKSLSTTQHYVGATGSIFPNTDYYACHTEGLIFV